MNVRDPLIHFLKVFFVVLDSRFHTLLQAAAREEWPISAMLLDIATLLPEVIKASGELRVESSSCESDTTS